MYNKRKYLAHKIGSICAMVLGVFVFIGLLITVISFFEVCDDVDIPGATMIGFMIGLGLRGYIGFLFWNLGKQGKDEPELYNDSKTGKSYWLFPEAKETWTLILVSAGLFILGISVNSLDGMSVGNVAFKAYTWAQWIQNILCLVVALAKIVALMLPDEEPANSASEEKKPSIEEKIGELKKLKESGAISEEAYEKAVQELISQGIIQK